MHKNTCWSNLRVWFQCHSFCWWPEHVVECFSNSAVCEAATQRFVQSHGEVCFTNSTVWYSSHTSLDKRSVLYCCYGIVVGTCGFGRSFEDLVSSGHAVVQSKLSIVQSNHCFLDCTLADLSFSTFVRRQLVGQYIRSALSDPTPNHFTQCQHTTLQATFHLAA